LKKNGKPVNKNRPVIFRLRGEKGALVKERNDSAVKVDSSVCSRRRNREKDPGKSHTIKGGEGGPMIQTKKKKTSKKALLIDPTAKEG